MDDHTCSAPQLDLLSVGPIFNDLLFTGLGNMPQPGSEVYATHLAHTIGGAANVARAAARLTMRAGLVCDVGDDPLVEPGLDELRATGVQLFLTRHEGWATPTTSIYQWGGDRAMVTAAQPLSDSVLSAGWSYPARVLVSSIPKDEARWLTMVSPDTIVIGDCGWDDTGAWNLDALRHQGRVDIFTPNIDEALAYTGAKTARDAAVELATVFATVVVTCGAGGAVLAHAGEVIEVEAPDVTVTDTTGAGECFNAALGFGLINPQWSWELRLRCAVLAASISVTRSGHTSAPTLDDVAELASRLGGQWAQLATALDG